MKNKDYLLLVQKILHMVDEGVHAIDSEGKTIIYNDAMAALEKMERQDVLSTPFFDVFPGMEENNSTLFQALKSGKNIPWHEQTYINKNGGEITTINRTMPVFRDGEVIAAIEISKDVTNIQKMSHTILELQKDAATKQGKHPARRARRQYRFDDLWGENEDFGQCLRLAKKAAKNSASVLIYGETGTGKELFAQSIHYGGIRKEHPFIAQNCAALPSALLEGILFGTGRGGFTGAVDREGIFEQADGGTLLLDEINSMPIELQGKLLRVLQEGYIRRVGGTKDILVDIRFIATVNEPVDELIRAGTLRKDLYYRLNVIPINLPPLRKRRDDIMLLANKFLKQYNSEFGKNIENIAHDAESFLIAHDYPGNVRELENLIMSAVSMSERERFLSLKDLGAVSVGQRRGAAPDFREEGLDAILDDAEREMIETALATSDRNVSRAAECLKIKRQTLQHKMRKYGIRR
ncbi:MAG: sigma 54-interacting transcriptional regulator [Clostridiales Family XIII bacterium]|jgi:arginine utilization regulatory protein|nr:sigma 54-interacting transcriptional regulator [Clostridiales Family XIII bacterium]